MKNEKSIIFSGLMVRAILEGRKTMTRRLKGLEEINADPSKVLSGRLWDGSPSDPRWWDLYIPEMGISKRVKCPYVVGDRLWVRETWLDGLSGRTEEEKASREDVSYRADGEAWEQFEDHMDAKWQPPIFMPRWASRITLEVTDVRAERLQGISQKDAAAEGFVGEMYCPSPEMCLDIDRCNFDAELHFKKAWDKINGKKYPWASNPWVWVIAFRRVEK